MTRVVVVIHFSSPALNFSSVSVARVIIKASGLDALEVFVIGDCGGMSNVVFWIVVESLARSHLWRMRPSHEIVWL